MRLALEQLISRAEISDLVHRYAFNVRAGKGAESAMLFTEDGVFEIRETDSTDLTAARTRNILSGRNAILQYLQHAERMNVKLCPLISNLLIEVNGNEASSSCVMTNRIWPGGSEMIGEYRDRFQRGTEWRFVSRIYTIFGTVSATIDGETAAG
jgi:SnoaL-like domain